MKCHSFAWYLENVYPELQIPGNKSSTDSKVGIGKVDSRRQGLARKRYRTKNFVAKYQIRISGSSLCLQSEQDVTTKGSSLVAARCSRGTKRQMWHESDRNELVLAELLCLESPEGSLSSQKPHLAKCHEMGGLQDWKHTGEIDTPIYNTAAGLCLGVDVSVNELPGFIAENTHIVMTLCSESTATKWDFIHVWCFNKRHSTVSSFSFIIWSSQASRLHQVSRLQLRCTTSINSDVESMLASLVLPLAFLIIIFGSKAFHRVDLHLKHLL